ncbi:MAG: 23S rRNA (pseudouridine(1915)-N(3))-methyltransferase RlmH [Bryobacteraceae bacterium]|nr:23S rRNA (pseudouridine(1915)-N(3))-methyltransferase RlmH [Solibacteraceae bacterium]MCL4844408.1 23S rRNA (pseudouridine(1915)-N(3))-methyltransferase RlmH [Bryobacteraceae bacterium]MCO5353252.1 23S rRNA (pseudouridine(1915)-N(3))-methyltransferase RlmH [Bryobacteraceae bacterium]
MTLHLLFVGRPRDAHANALAQEYIKRSSRFLACRMAEIDPRRFDLFQRHPASLKVFLDPAGGQFTSAQFQGLVESTRLEARDLVFLVGGHDGLPPEWRSRADILLSLTPLTLPHELARAVLAEQIYRALAAMNNHPYGR